MTDIIQAQEERLQRRAEMAIKHGMSRDDFYSLMYRCFGFNQASYALECYDEITHFMQEVAK